MAINKSLYFAGLGEFEKGEEMNTEHLIQNDTSVLIDMAYDALEGAEDLIKYHRAHGTPSLLVLTQYSPEIAQNMARLLEKEILGKVVIEIGAGVGFLAIELARKAKQVFAIEVDPAWSWVFTHSLYAHKPPNLTWIFGKAETMVGHIHGDIAVVVTHSGIEELQDVALQFAPVVLMPLQGTSYNPLQDFTYRKKKARKARSSS